MTLDTKALEAAARAHSPKLWAMIDANSEDDGWGGGTAANARATALSDMVRAIEAYTATRTQSLPDELKAIVERWDKHLRAMRVAEKLPGFKGWQDWERDISTLRSFIPDVERKAREEERERCAKIAERWTADILRAGDQFDQDGDIYRHANVTQAIATTIRNGKTEG